MTHKGVFDSQETFEESSAKTKSAIFIDRFDKKKRNGNVGPNNTNLTFDGVCRR